MLVLTDFFRVKEKIGSLLLALCDTYLNDDRLVVPSDHASGNRFPVTVSDISTDRRVLDKTVNPGKE